MNRAELVKAVAARLGGSDVDADRAVCAVVDVVADAVASGERVTVSGFGSWRPVERNARLARDVNRGVPVWVGPRVVPVFEASPKFDAYVRSGVKESGSITGRATKDKEVTE